ncbi:hypothetical protein IQ266_01285 [filamentous cyanobacterium LEGE 11480]|uniref:Uncharacterized protein n=1 Tax=Romeriopsis navalis LEGE 11480 TaxID=2777977 RepID=A0A928VGV9_9CYAN|nr:hypothetical protein [Romeriopsis navalis]MBE9028386.1 hypothetical protein [Romeriopsis navalis LEGE 11480]
MFKIQLPIQRHRPAPLPTPETYLQRIPAEMLTEFTPAQREKIGQILVIAHPKPAPKLVDLRLDINLIWQRFYLVLFVGQDRRQQKRRYLPQGITRLGNMIAALTLLAGFNLLISLIILAGLYAARTWFGIGDLPAIQLIDQPLNSIS